MNNQINDNVVERILFSEETEEEGFITIPFQVEDENPNKSENLEALPILPARNTVLFPGIVMPITVGRKKSIKLVKKAYKGDKLIGVITQHNPDAEDTAFDEIYKVGTLAQIMKIFTLPDGNLNIIIQGKKRIEVQEFLSDEPYITAKVKTLTENFPAKTNKQGKALMASVKDSASKIMQLNPEIPQDAKGVIDNIDNLSFLTHFLCSNLNVESTKKQKMLETNDASERVTLLLEYMNEEIQHLQIKQEINSKVHSDIDQQQRDYFLRQQIKIIQDELNGGHESNEMELDTLHKKAQTKKWSEKLAKHCQKEISKIAKMNPASAEYPVALNYVEFLLDLPWEEYTKDNHDLKNAKKILDKDHYGLEKVKERIIEYLAVLKLKNNLKSPILCLYGPPGVGKTSLGKSIAKALNRNYVRMALGGVNDEAEIRGHRKTYVGAMAGKILQNIKKAQSSNPVFILDEIDKVSSDLRGDPASALLEVLDPEQNNSFGDNYLDMDYDLSQVLFIATANSLDSIHPALRDRMEIIEITGYTQEEKLQIAKKHLIPEQRTEHGLQAKDIRFDDASIVKIIADYTRESGVRNLKRKIGAVCRKIAKAVASQETHAKFIAEKEIPKLLGSEIFDKEIAENENHIGVVTGLAWTQVGGEILFIEASLSKGKGRLTLSGQLGDVMKESAQTALSYLRSIAENLGIEYQKFEEYDLHVHVPAGAVPKDGPSAGITMLTALASVFTNKKVKSHVAMTGEITLRGRVLPVGGIKEKILSAKRAGIKEIILCEKNKRDIEEIDQNYIKDIVFHFVKNAEDVLKLVFVD